MTLWYDMIFRVPVARFVDFTHTIDSKEPGLALGAWALVERRMTVDCVNRRRGSGY
jgi:hypothetical protein